MNNLGAFWQMGLVILALLSIASLAVEILVRRRPEKDLSELVDRTRSWWVMAGLFFAALAFGSTVSLVFFAFLSYWALKEYLTLLKTRPADHRALLYAFLAVPLQYFWIRVDATGMALIFIPIYMGLVLPTRLVLAKDTTGFVASASQIQWGLTAFVLGLSHLGLMARLPPLGGEATGRTLLLFLVFVVELSDVMQYVWGRTLGRHKILPTVSPNKTWEGFLGGIATTITASLALRFLTPFSVPETLLASLLITVAGFCGGAVMSAVKRDFGVKDFGKLIPGHGGMLDRIDSLCYAAPVFYHFVRYFHH